MRPLELLFLASLVLASVALFVAPGRRNTLLRRAPTLALTLALVHVFIDEGRWTLYGAYALAALLAAAATWRLRSEEAEARDRPWLRRLGGVFALVVTVACGALSWVVPIFSIQQPSGKYKVGSRWLFLPDSSRDEDLTPEPGDKRALAVRIWFPADSVAGSTEAYAEPDVAKAIGTAIQLPGFAFSHLSSISTNSYRRAWLPATPARFPLLIFSHGYGGTESQNTTQMEELASHGFVVASIDHTYEAAAVVFPDGSLHHARLPFDPVGDTVALRETLSAIKRLGAARDTTESWALIQQMYETSKPMQQSIERWTQDTRFVLDRLTAASTPHVGPDTLFPGRLDTSRIGVFGMSFGGATAASFCQVDPRCAAGLDLDGLIYGEAARAPFPRPFVIVSSEESENVHRIFYERSHAPAWLLIGKQAKHIDWTDMGYAVRGGLGTKLGILGGIAPDRTHAIMNGILVDYFDGALRNGKGLDAATLRQRFPELLVNQRDGTPPAAVASADSAALTATAAKDAQTRR